MGLTLLVVADPADATLSALASVGPGVEVVVGDRPSAFAEAAARAGAVLSWSGDRRTLEAVLAQAPAVRWVHSWAAGIEGLLFPALVESPAILTNTRGVYSRSLAEFALGAMLHFAKDLPRMQRAQRARRWEPFDVKMLDGATLGIAGYGDIGRAVATLGRSMGMKLLALRRHPERSAGDPLEPEAAASARALCERSDYLVLSAPATPETRHLVGRAELAVMKPGAVLINVGRGSVVDQAALVEALRRGALRGAALDVFETEPLPPDDALWGLDNVLLSPHCADHTATWRHEAMRLFLDNLARFRAGEPLRHVVDKQRGY